MARHIDIDVWYRSHAARIDDNGSDLVATSGAEITDAAAGHVGGDRYDDPASLDLLAAAGADLDAARRIWATRSAQGNPLHIVADQANRADRGRPGRG